jgi:hypothetical protein
MSTIVLSPVTKTVISNGSYVWYNKKDCIAKVQGYDSYSNSYTIECKGKIIDTLSSFINFLAKEETGEKETERERLLNVTPVTHAPITKKKSVTWNSTIEFPGYFNRDDCPFFSSGDLLNEHDELFCVETVISNNFNEEKTEKFPWKDLNDGYIPTINLYEDFTFLKTHLTKRYLGSYNATTIANDIQSWNLQKGEYIVGVYYATNNDVVHQWPIKIEKKSKHVGVGRSNAGACNELIFYTSYGNITAIQYSVRDGGFYDAKKVNKYRNEKMLTTKMINIINKSISSGNTEIEHVMKKTSLELNDFICYM